MPTELTLFVLTFFTSGMTAFVGVGGGMVLIAVLPFLLRPEAIIPLHGINQFASNVSRAAASRRHIRWRVVPSFLLGSLLGIVLMSLVVSVVSLEYIPLFIGGYMLLSLHSRRFNERIRRFESYFVIGFFQTGLSLVVGSTGPLSMTLLFKEFHDKEVVVSTQATLMSTTHLFKIGAFLGMGFAFSEYAMTIVAMMLGSTLGSYAGTAFRRKIDTDRFNRVLKILLTLLALKMIALIFF